MTIPGTIDGVKFELHDEVLDDYEILESLSEIVDGNSLAAAKLAPALFGKAQFDRIKNELRDDSGVVRSSAVVPFILQALEVAAEAKRGELKN